MHIYSSILLFTFFACQPSNTEVNLPVTIPISANARPVLNYKQLHTKAQKAFQYCKANKLNTQFAILIDMSRHSGLNRFYVWNFTKDTFTHSFPVSHGCGNNAWGSDESKENPVFSAKDGSHCTALGKYKIGERGYSNWGIHIKYLMHGLEPTNKNALSRQIVFHGWNAISDVETFPNGTPEGWGCPAISNNNMYAMDEQLKGVSVPVLMWIFN